MEKSCGTVLYRLMDGIKYFALVKSVNGHIGFPKGHVEKGETEEETALRETFEEIGINAAILPNFSAVEEYVLPNGTTKQVVYFIAEYSNQEFNIDPNEIEQVFSLPFKDALNKLTFKEAKDVLIRAQEYMG